MNNLMKGMRGFFSTEHKRLRSTFALLLSVIVMISVFASLIRPAISATSGTVQAVSANGSGGTDLNNYDDVRAVTNAYPIETSASSSDTGIYEVLASIVGDQIDENGTTQYDTKFSVNFNLKADVVDMLSQHSDSITFNVKDLNNPQEYPDYFTAIDDTANLQGPVYSSDNSGLQIGKYVFDPVTGQVKIKFFSSFLNDQNGIGGGFTVEAWVWNNNNSKEDRNVQLAGKSVDVPIYRYTHTPDLTVKKTYNNDFFYGTPGYEMKNERALGSSFTIEVKSKNGVNGTEITFTDDLTGKDGKLDIHFDLQEGATWPLYQTVNGKETEVTNAHVEIVNIEGAEGSDQTLTAKIVADNEDVLKKGFDFYWKCPVMVNDEHIVNGKVNAVKDVFDELYADNTVKAKAEGVPLMSDSSVMQVGLIADIAKDAGVYDPTDNTIKWTVKIYKDDGWWKNHTIKFTDKIGGENGEVPEIVGTPTMQIVRSSGNEGDDAYNNSGTKEDSDPTSNGVYPLAYDAENGIFTITMTEDVEEEGEPYWPGYNDIAVKEFIIEYKTKVTSEDYGKNVANFVGLHDPDKPGEFNDKDDTAKAYVDKPSVDKSHSMDNSGITWKITVDNSRGQDLTGLTLTDILTGTSDENIPVDFSDAALNATVNGQSLTEIFDVSGNVLTFKEGQKNTSYEIKYTQTVKDMEELSGKSFKNDAELEEGDRKLDEDEDEARVPKALELEKTGYVGADGKMHYTVTVVNLWNADLSGLKVTDVLTLTKNYSSDVDASGFAVEMESSGVTPVSTADGNKLTTEFTIDVSTTAERFEIKYAVTPPGGDFRNDYGYHLGNAATLGDNIDTKYFDTDINKFVDLNYKTVWYDKDSNKDMLVWKIRINNTYGLDLGQYPSAREAYKLYDSMFGIGDIVSLKIMDDQGNDIATEADLAAVNSSARTEVGGVESGSYTFPEGSTSSYYELIYETKHPDDQTDYKASNTAQYGEDKREAETTVYNYNTNFKAEKWAAGEKGQIDDAGKFVMRWHMKVTTTYGSMLSYVITDTMTAYENHSGEKTDNEAIKHYMTPEQFTLDNFTFQARDKDWNLIADESYDLSQLFKLTAAETDADGNITSFTISAADDYVEGTTEYQLLWNIAMLEIEYNVTGTGADQIRNEDFSNGDTIVYENEVDFPRTNPATAQQIVDRKAPLVKYIEDYKYDSGQFRNESWYCDLGLSELNHNEEGKYYTIAYKLAVNGYNNFDKDTDITVTDTLPEGMSLLDIHYNEDGAVTPGAAQPGQVTYSLNGQELEIYISSGVHQGKPIDIIYTLKITDEDMEALISSTSNGTNGSAHFDNTAGIDGEYDTIPLTVVDDVDVITKTGLATDSNKVKYTLDINPNSRQLNYGEVLTVRDTINLNDENGTKYAICPIIFNQLTTESVKVYKVDADGNETLMDTSEFGFNTPVKESYPVKKYTVWGQTGEDDSGNAVYGNLEYDMGYGDVYSFELTIPDETHIRIVYDYAFEFNEASRAVPNLDVDSMKLKNQAVIDGSSYISEKEENYQFNKNETSSATAFGAPKLVLRKVSENNWFEGLSGAEFILQRYDPETYSWLYMTTPKTFFEVYEKVSVGDPRPLNTVAFATWTENEADAVKLITEGASGQKEIPNLQNHYNEDGKEYFEYSVQRGKAKYFYRLREVKAPSGYYFEEGERDYYFYETPKNTDPSEYYPTYAVKSAQDAGLLPDGTEIHSIRSGSNIELPNDQVELDIQKLWSSEEDKANASSVYVKLYKSNTAPALAEARSVSVDYTVDGVTTSKTYYIPLNETFRADLTVSGPSGSWIEDSPSSDTLKTNSKTVNGGLVTYAIEGKAPVTDDAHYTLSVSGNGVYSLYSDNVTSEALTAEQTGIPDDAEAIGSQIELSSENGWYYKLPSELLEANTYYYIKELTPNGYSAYYLANGIKNSGTLRLENTRNELDVAKYWTDPGSDARPTEISLKLYETERPQDVSNVHFVTLTATRSGGTLFTSTYAVNDGATFSADLLFDSGQQYSDDYGSSSDSLNVSKVKSGEDLTLTVTGKAPVTSDASYLINLNMSNEFRFKKALCTCATAGETALDTTGLEPIAEFTLTEEDGWKASLDELDGVKIRNDRYYYVVETAPDGYEATYPVNGKNSGELKVINYRDNTEMGSIEVDKTWLDDKETDVQALTFKVYAYTQQQAQTPSEYSRSVGSSTVTYRSPVAVNVQFSGDNGYSKTERFFGEAGESVYICIGGRDFYNNNFTATVNGTQVQGDAKSDNAESNGQRLRVDIPSDASDPIAVVIKVEWSEGVSNKQYTDNPTSDDFILSYLNSGGEELYSTTDLTVTKPPEPEPVDGNKKYQTAEVTLPEAEPVAEYEFTVTKKDGKWTGSLGGLPLATKTGQKLYYYIKEQSGAAFVPINYSENGFELTADETETVKVVNQSEDVTWYELPESGGEGTEAYIITGGALMLGALMYYILNKRRVKN
ncbi:MAG: hypothetical protein IJ561_04440 [Ruminococcus sp.]|nr:hypothetical protein [Ruminococcus sp.]